MVDGCWIGRVSGLAVLNDLPCPVQMRLEGVEKLKGIFLMRMMLRITQEDDLRRRQIL